jgi:hypothetical protein
MRKAWKKEAMELLLDPAFFQMDVNSLIHWKQTVDNMMTQERKTIDELLSKSFIQVHKYLIVQHLIFFDPTISGGMIFIRDSLSGHYSLHRGKKSCLITNQTETPV